MGMLSGQTSEDSQVFVTREVRWFVSESLPPAIVEWFTSTDAPVIEEHRIDRYDAVSARSGIGLKYRAASTFDAKYLLAHESEESIADRVVGLVGDWVKVSRPILGRESLNAPLIVVDKHLRTRRYALAATDDDADFGVAGCEVELAAVSTTAATAWSLCFETFGAPERRYEALRHGVEAFFADTPLPPELRFEPQCSCGYPTWIAERCVAA